MRGLSLLEVTVAATLLGGVLTLYVVAVDSGSKELASTRTRNRCVERVERALDTLESELRNSGLGGTANLTVTASGLQAGAPRDVVTYTPLVGADPADPFLPRWGERRVIRFEAEPGETLGNGQDDDGDLRVDEGRLVLYRDPPSPANQIAVLCEAVQGFTLELEAGSPAGMPAVEVTLISQEPLRAAIRGTPNLNTLPRVEYRGRVRVPLWN